MRKLRIRYMDIQQLDIPFRSIFIVIIIYVIKINILKVAWWGQSWVNVSLRLFLFGGFSIKLMATESLEFFFIPLRIFFYLGW